MSADILDAILGGGDVTTTSAKQSSSATKTEKPIGESAAKISLDVLTPYDLGQALDAISTHHHARAVKFANAIIAALSSAIEPNERRSTLDATLEAIEPYIAKAKIERGISAKFEATALRVGKDVRVGQLLDVVRRDAVESADDDEGGSK